MFPICLFTVQPSSESLWNGKYHFVFLLDYIIVNYVNFLFVALLL